MTALYTITGFIFLAGLGLLVASLFGANLYLWAWIALGIGILGSVVAKGAR